MQLELIRYTVDDCYLGRVLIACSARGLCALLLGDSSAALEDDLAAMFAHARLVRDPLPEARAQVLAVLDDPRVSHALPLDLRGTPFQMQVWRALCDTRPGETLTYGELAKRIGRAGAARAVGSACGANPIGVLVPCHRVVNRDPRLSSYGFGVARKRALLQREAECTTPSH